MPGPPPSPPGDFGDPPGHGDPPGFDAYAWPSAAEFGAGQAALPGYPPLPRKQYNSFAVVSLVAGVLGILGSCVCFLSFPSAILGLVSGYSGLQRVKREPERFGGRNLAFAGIACSAAGIAITVVLMILNIRATTTKLF